MSTLALIHPTDLLSVELRQSLDRRRDLWGEMVLLSTSDEEIGSLTEARGAAAMVQNVANQNWSGIDVAFFGGPIEANRDLIAKLPSQAAAIVMSTDADAADGQPIVAGVNLDAANRDSPMVSPHPTTVMLAHLLHPLRAFAPRLAVATVLQPVSMVGKAGLDEVIDQTRGILTFADNPPREIFPHQMVFNVVPSTTPEAILEQQLRAVLGVKVQGETGAASSDNRDLGISISLLQAGIFHGFSVSLYLELRENPGAQALRDALIAHSMNTMAEQPATLGPVDAVAGEKVMIGDIEPVGSPGDEVGRYKLWAAMDNLTCGGALNAIQILEAISHQPTH